MGGRRAPAGGGCPIRGRCLAVVILVAAAATALLASPSVAQGRPVLLTPATTAVNATEGDPALFDLHLRNAEGLLPHSVRLVVEAPAGWEWAFTPPVVNLTPGGRANATLVLTPPVTAVEGDSHDFVLRGVENDPTQRPVTEDVTVSVRVVARPPPPPPAQPVPPRVQLSATEAQGPAGQSVKGALTLLNADDAPLTVALSVLAPAGWSANVAVPTTRVLYVGDPVRVDVFARSPAEAPLGVATLRLQARVDGFLFEVPWNVTVEAPPAPAPAPEPAPTPAQPTSSGPSTSQAPPEDPAVGVQLALDHAELEVAPGGTAATILRVTNSGGVPLSLRLAGRVPEGWSPLRFEVETFDLPAGAARDVRVHLDAPADAVADPRGTGSGAVVVTSDAGLMRSVPFAVRVAPVLPQPDPTVETAPGATLSADAPPAIPAAVGVAVGVGAVGAGAAVLARRPWREKALWLAVGLYTRLARPDVLGHDERQRLYGLIEARPGVHFHALQRDLAWNTGTLTYHLRVLERHGFVVSRRDGLYRRFYLSGAAPRKETFNQGPQGLRADVLEGVRGQPGISQSDLALALGQNKQTVNYHVKALERQGLLRIEKRGRDTYLYPAGPGAPETAATA